MYNSNIFNFDDFNEVLDKYTNVLPRIKHPNGLWLNQIFDYVVDSNLASYGDWEGINILAKEDVNADIVERWLGDLTGKCFVVLYEPELHDTKSDARINLIRFLSRFSHNEYYYTYMSVELANYFYEKEDFLHDLIPNNYTPYDIEIRTYTTEFDGGYFGIENGYPITKKVYEVLSNYIIKNAFLRAYV